VKEIVDEIGLESRTIWKNLLIICPTLCMCGNVKAACDHA
jgi:hypothetical protein